MSRSLALGFLEYGLGSDCTYSNHSLVEGEALGLDEEDGAVILVGLGCLEGCLVLVRVELLAIGVKPLKTVLLQCLHEDRLGHLETRVEVGKILVASVKLFGRHD